MGKRRKRRKYKDVRFGNLGINQTLEYMNPNIITEKELIILIILKLLSEKLKQNDSMLNKNLQTKKESFYKNPLWSLEKLSERNKLDSLATYTKVDGVEDDKEEQVMLIVEDKKEPLEVDIKEGIDFTKNNALDLKENVYIDENKHKDSEIKIICKSKAIVEKTTLLRCCENGHLKSSYCLEEAIFKVPVVLSEIEIPVFIVATQEFTEPVFKITSLDKRVILEKCHIVRGINKLFIKGVIEESVKYSTVNYSDKRSIKGDIKSLVLNIPFKCSTEVSFATKPKFYNNSCFSNIEPSMEGINNIGTYEEYQGELEHISDKIFCNLKSSRILEINNKQFIKSSEDMLKGTDTFKRIEKKMILVLKLTLLQNQDVFNYNKNKAITP
ncbi:hypothetical protein [Clostridium algidicarnis]|uniref:hypothetical protein n=1 Tax=Clostridium algidicarnis TaxID=37659 RepID=UPI001C0D3216|nr:hypothetical protein [Clostridium algidicarnis]MBU3204677.1 hypothetical protein [Clostridium algidicarnis]MBU3212838.1 hypothetical protein [Clostridium algidicarnis]MBU3223482.1 hypothetical protein [Clostridium algidicarnis]